MAVTRTVPTVWDNPGIVRHWNRTLWQTGSISERLLAPGCRFHGIGGCADVQRFVEQLHTAFADIELDIAEQFEIDDRVVTRWCLFATHQGELWGIPATGRRVRLTGITINRLVDGRIVEEWCESDWFSLLQQISGYLTDSGLSRQV